MHVYRSRAAAAVAGMAAGVIAALALSGCAGTTSAGGTSASKASGAGQQPTRHRGPAGFAWFHSRATPDSWHRVSLPNGTAVLSYPQSLHPLHGDKGTVTAGITTKSGSVLVYLNVTPKQGDETLRNWPDFRVQHLLEDNASAATRAGQATGLEFRGGQGSCVLDSYTTKAHANHYREIACFVQGAHGASVLVAATAAADWASYAGLLEEAVNAYAVS
jgi:hypothetical protein